MPQPNTHVEFKVSSFSKDSLRRLCVGVKMQGEKIIVGNTKIPGKTVSFTEDEWEAFIAGVKLGEFEIASLRNFSGS
ncbi:DUF397 domain-containing protein [Luteolibacter ambystomatis]|uniref:DUF397 domain-containing protein n=1 Tax=Luteolibacter ambystomatis TaxID=2824561 RepID=A0A975IYJ9_9BACT|nr:DUF397 domain-containing protein [Luteolibacter ambystomatis]